MMPTGANPTNAFLVVFAGPTDCALVWQQEKWHGVLWRYLGPDKTPDGITQVPIARCYHRDTPGAVVDDLLSQRDSLEVT